MKRAVYLITALLLLFAGTGAEAQSIRNVDIRVELATDGSAWITQKWDVWAASGTEWYIPVENLGPMTVSSLSVSEDGHTFQSLGDDWDVNASRSQKAGKCGVVRKRNGVELCWGLGELGEHNWTARFHVTGLVQSLRDADGFNFMFVNPGMVAPPQKASVTILPPPDCPEWTLDNTLIWAFGYPGSIVLDNGKIILKSEFAFDRDHYMTALVRFEKGLFSPTVSRDIPFQEMLDKAMEGSDYAENDDTWAMLGYALLFIGGIFLLLFMAIAKLLGYKYRKSLFGKRKIDGWYREAPVEGNLMAACFVLARAPRFSTTIPPTSQMIGALFLRWVMDGKLAVEPDPKSDSRVLLRFVADTASDDSVEEDLFQMAREASGDNLVLEKGEFERWSRQNYTKMTGWPERAVRRGQSWFNAKGYFLKGRTTNQEGALEACHVIEFRNFLKDFTLSKERAAGEVALWKDYLVFAQLFGIADRVTKQFKKLYPAEFEKLAQETGMNTRMLSHTVLWTNTLSNKAFTTATAKAARVSGHGGHASFGGGGGFSGGGFGGGTR